MTGANVTHISAARDLLAATGAGAPVSGQRGQAGPEPDTGQRRISLTPASAIPMRRTRWTWEGRIPSGALTLIPGREGIGKSLTLAWLSAMITTGRLPGQYFGTPRPVIYAATEDSWEHTIVPRLWAAGADMDMVLKAEVDIDGADGQLILPTDCRALGQEIRDRGVAMLAADPLLSLIHGKIDTHKDRELREALEPLAKMADASRCAVVGLAHFNKSDTADPLTAITGSRAFAAVARAVISIARNTIADDGTCVMSQSKNNLGRTDLPSLAYRVNSVEVPTDEGPTEVGALEMLGESEYSVDDVRNATPGRPEGGQRHSAAVDWLTGFLTTQGGGATRSEVMDAAKAAGLSERSIQRAKKAADVTAVRARGYQLGTYWTLSPGTVEPASGDASEADNGPDTHSRHIRANPLETGALGANGTNGTNVGTNPPALPFAQETTTDV